jgi:hypothetical protein
VARSLLLIFLLVDKVLWLLRCVLHLLLLLLSRLVCSGRKLRTDGRSRHWFWLCWQKVFRWATRSWSHDLLWLRKRNLLRHFLLTLVASLSNGLNRIDSWWGRVLSLHNRWHLLWI